MKYRILEKTNGFGKTTYVPQCRSFFCWCSFTEIITKPCVISGVVVEFDSVEGARKYIRNYIKKYSKPSIKVIPFP